jgi:hypothetical protein
MSLSSDRSAIGMVPSFAVAAVVWLAVPDAQGRQPPTSTSGAKPTTGSNSISGNPTDERERAGDKQSEKPVSSDPLVSLERDLRDARLRVGRRAIER